MAVKSKLAGVLTRVPEAFCAAAKFGASTTMPAIKSSAFIGTSLKLEPQLFPSGAEARHYLNGVTSLKSGASTKKFQLPHPASAGADHRLAWFASENLLECRRILHRSVHAPLSGGVRISQHALARLLVGNVLAPNLPVREEEPLLRCISVNRLYWRMRQNFSKRHVSQLQSAVVGGVFAQRQLAVQLDLALVVLHSNEVRVFFRGAVGALFELLTVLGGPPIAEVARSVVFTPLIVKAVRQFVTDDDADAAVIHGII